MAGGKYNRFFSVKITNNYYADDNGSRDMTIMPTIETREILKNHNLLFKPDNLGFRVYYKTVPGSNDPFTAFTSLDLKFRVDLINKPEFINFTNLAGSEAYNPDNLVFVTNKTDHSAATLERMNLKTVRPARFTYEFPYSATGSGDKGNLIVRNYVTAAVVTPDSPAATNILPNTYNKYNYPIDFLDLPGGVYEFETWTDSNSTHKIEMIYIDSEIAKNRPFGLIELFFESVNTGAANNTFTMWFQRRTTTWYYKVVLKSIEDAETVIGTDDFSITDSNDTQTPYNELEFTRLSDTTVNGIPTLTFISSGSNSPIPFFESPKRGLVFTRESTNLLTDLPGPSIHLPGSDFANTSGTEIFIYI